MDNKFIPMDFLTKHVAHLERHHPHSLPVQTIGFMPTKKDWIDQKFHLYAFSFILEGSGEFYFKNKCSIVEAPMVITQWPGAQLKYGPDKKSGHWKEVYFTYHPQSISYLEKLKFIQKDRFLWKIHSPHQVLEWIMKIYDLCHSKETFLTADYLDRFSEQLLLISQEKPLPKPESLIDRKLAEAEKEIRKSFRNPIDFAEIARKRSISYTHFRRLWTQKYGISLAQFQSQLLMNEACRRLVESRQRIFEIAHDLGFEDSLYFSRKFKKFTKKSPQDYRDSYQISGE